MSKLSTIAVFVAISSIFAIVFSTSNQNYKPLITPVVANNANYSLDDEAWLRGDDLPDEQRGSHPQLLIPTGKSVSFFERRIEKWPSDPRNYVMLGRLYLRQAKETDDFSRFVAAEECFKKSIALGDKKYVAHTFLARALLAQHKFAESATVATKAWKANPKNELAHATMGDAALQMGEYEKARSIFETLLKESKTPALMARLARVKELTGELEQAFELLKEATAKQAEFSADPRDDAWFHWRLAEFKFGQGDLDAAQKYANRALEIVPDDAHSLATLAKIQAIQGETTQAIENYQKSVALLDAPPTRLAFGELLEKENRIDDAETHFVAAETAMAEEAQDPNAGPAHARERAIYFLRRDKNLAKALDIASQELKIRKDIFTYDLLAWAQFKNGQFVDAAKTIENALKTDCRDALILFHAGMIHNKLKNDQQSLEFLKRAIEVNPHFDLILAEQAKSQIKKLESKA